jgi:hypothetical protein
MKWMGEVLNGHEVHDMQGSVAVLPKRGSEAGAGAGSGSAGAHFSKNGRERSVSGAFLYIYI